MFVSELHKHQNKKWHALYPDDLEHNEIVPINAFRYEKSSYWCVPNVDNFGYSRWRSKKQVEKMHAYISSQQFEDDMEELHIKLVHQWRRAHPN